MKLPQLRKKRQGFTLIELLTVIAIIGILAGALSVVVPLVKKKAAQNDAMNNCRSIAVGYQSYASAGTSPKNISKDKAATVADWAVYLAQKAEINEGRLWFIASDPALDSIKAIPQQVINPVTKAADTDFVAAKPKSWAVVASASRSADSTYPIIWTRGLSGTKWNETSPWGGQGGHVGFAGGNVAWFTSTVDDQSDRGIFIDYTSKKPTSSVSDAIGTAASIVQDTN